MNNLRTRNSTSCRQISTHNETNIKSKRPSSFQVDRQKSLLREKKSGELKEREENEIGLTGHGRKRKTVVGS